MAVVEGRGCIDFSFFNLIYFHAFFSTDFKSRGFSKLSNSEDSDRMNVALLSAPVQSSANQGIRTSNGSAEGKNSSNLKLQGQLPVAHSTLRDSKQKLALRFHEVNGPPSIHIESPVGSSTLLTISVGDLLSPGIPHSKSKAFFIEVTQTPCSSDQDTELNEKFSLRRYYKSLPARLRTTGNEAKENSRRSSSIF